MKIGIAFGAAALVAASSAAMATTSYDLTSIGSSATINGGRFMTWDQRAAGSGVFNSFVRVSAANQDTVQGYNTSGRPLRFDENNSPTFTHDVVVSDLPIANIGGTNYYEFTLDINQQASDPLLSLDAVKIFTNSVGGLNPTNINSLGTLRYDMDLGDDATVELNYNNFTGSGQADMVMYIPTSAFGSTSDYLYLYSFFGIPNNNNDGYEEWGHRDAVSSIPLPQAAFMGFAGLTGLVAMRRRNGR